MVRYFGSYLKERKGIEDPAEISDGVNRMLYGLSESIMHGALRHVATSVALDTLSLTFDKVRSEVGGTSVELQHVAAKMESCTTFPLAEVESFAKANRGNDFAYELLRQLVWQNFHLFYRDRATIQRICSRLDISVPESVFLGSGRKKLRGG